jgi:hypothetical protein
MMTHLWVYDGALDEGGSVLRLDAECPAFIGEGMANYQDLDRVRERRPPRAAVPHTGARR